MIPPNVTFPPSFPLALHGLHPADLVLHVQCYLVHLHNIMSSSTCRTHLSIHSHFFTMHSLSLNVLNPHLFTFLKGLWLGIMVMTNIPFDGQIIWLHTNVWFLKVQVSSQLPSIKDFSWSTISGLLECIPIQKWEIFETSALHLPSLYLPKYITTWSAFS